MSRIWLLQFIKTTFKVAHFYRHDGSSWIAPGHYFFPALTPYTVICSRLHIHCPKAAQKHLKTTKTRKYRQRAVLSLQTQTSRGPINNDWELTWTYNLFRKIITQSALVLWLFGSLCQRAELRSRRALGLRSAASVLCGEWKPHWNISEIWLLFMKEIACVENNPMQCHQSEDSYFI